MKPVAKEREAELRSLTRKQLLYYLEDNESEVLMKEVWEECVDKPELAISDDEIKQIAKLIRSRGP